MQLCHGNVKAKQKQMPFEMHEDAIIGKIESRLGVQLYPQKSAHSC